MIEIKAPEFPESITDGEIAVWHVQTGESVHRDQVLVDIETDKVVLEVVAPTAGVLTEILKEEGETILSEDVLAIFEAGAVDEAAIVEAEAGEKSQSSASESAVADAPASPAAKKIASENKIDVTRLTGSGKGGRITKEDVLKAVADAEKRLKASPLPIAANEPAPLQGDRVERRVAMTRLRASIARRLVDAQQTAAMLTTFNEVDMTAIMQLRTQYKEAFEKAHNGTRLGFMSFFVRASVEALKRFPGVNASIDGNDIVYHGYQDIGVAVGSPRGLVVPVLNSSRRK